MNNVNKTMYIPLYGKAYVSRKGVILCDKKAEEIWEQEGFPLKGKSKTKWLAYYMGMRSAVFDNWVKDKLTENPQAVVLHIGCGLDSRVLRVGDNTHKWYDIDFAEVIAERKRYYSENEQYTMLSSDVRDNEWLKAIPANVPAVVIMEGVSMYMKPQELKDLFNALCCHFSSLALLVDCYTVLAAKLTKIKNPINDVGVTSVYGIDDPKMLESDKATFICEHEITPQYLVDELSGGEKRIFQKMYAGKTSKKLYKLYEYSYK